jgi:hypothetical protein
MRTDIKRMNLVAYTAVKNISDDALAKFDLDFAAVKESSGTRMGKKDDDYMHKSVPSKNRHN